MLNKVMLRGNLLAAVWAAFLLGFLLPGQVLAGDAYEIQAGDVLVVSVWKEPDLQSEVLVRPDGGFSFPLAGNIDARGKSVEQIQVELVEQGLLI